MSLSRATRIPFRELAALDEPVLLTYAQQLDEEYEEMERARGR